MKRVITNYTFDASLGTVTFELFTRITYADIYTITNLTDDTLIFDPVSLPGTVSGNVLTLSYDTSSMNDDDYLRIDYNYKQNYDGTNAVDGYDNVDILTDPLNGDKGVKVIDGVYDSETGAKIVVSKSNVSEVNTTTTTLGISGVFEGEWVDTLNYSEIIVSIGTDQDSIVDGLKVCWSSDGITENGNDTFTINANTDKTFSFPCQRQYVKVEYTNGTTAQTSFNLSTILKANASKGSSHNIKENIADDDDAILTKSVLTARSDDGVFRNIPSDLGGNLRVNSFPYVYAIAEGDIVGHSAILKFGTRTAVASNTSSTIWEGTSALKPYITTAGTLSVVSSSAADSSGGTGIRTLTLIGLDANWEEYSETITLNGITPVVTTGTFIRIFRAFGATCGTSLTNVGTINVTRAATQVLTIPPGDGQTLMATWTVPLGKVAYITALSASTNSNKGARVSMFTRLNDGGILYPFRIRYRAFLFSGSELYPFQIPFSLEAKTDIEIRFLTPASAGTTSAGATFELWYEDV